MTHFHRWKNASAALMAMAITTGAIAPMFAPTPASAQLLRGQNGQYNQYNRSISIPSGVTIPITYEKDRIVVTPDETTSLTVRVARNIIDRSGNVLIPEGSEIIGQIEPARNSDRGVRFVARELVLNDGNRISINATSRVNNRREKIKKGASTDRILTDAAIGAGAATAISLLTGNRRVEVLEPIGGAAAGALASTLLRRKEADVIVIQPRSGELDVTLRSNLLLSRSYY
ncbi:conjugal transfer protein TrbI [Iningainema tapete]|uniref:Conjugal transfer protein TrbI n=1 Tax=Iningainema tapete BLCC-T55 TaxID=2748662 RepID=A0A8J6XE28_9CYAN|nr:conjugal transfer protein TrbI [Iningainema tapete]MBD2770772.1 conjugal transfer protein TrbI [Iningainema tapete BLCC-T55]